MGMFDKIKDAVGSKSNREKAEGYAEQGVDKGIAEAEKRSGHDVPGGVEGQIDEQVDRIDGEKG
ncbi:MAG: hypothetical protein S0880_12240 [Actinomycetota bacterium]|nr:hypothetical protein [Actinomycetota bacterium]